jgi:molybdopterin converting factor subunit 1
MLTYRKLWNPRNRPVVGFFRGVATMRVKVKLFAAAREMVGQGEVAVDLHEGGTVGDLMDQVFARYPKLKGIAASLIFAVNREMVERTAGLREGDEVGVLPPVSGGRNV